MMRSPICSSGLPSMTETEEHLVAFLDLHRGSDAKQVTTECAHKGQASLDLLGREVAVVVTDSCDDQSVSDVSSGGDDFALVSD